MYKITERQRIFQWIIVVCFSVFGFVLGDFYRPGIGLFAVFFVCATLIVGLIFMIRSQRINMNIDDKFRHNRISVDEILKE